jgi:hypothetical protein
VVANPEYVEEKKDLTGLRERGERKKKRAMDESTTYETGSGKRRKETTGEKEIRMEGKKLRATEKRLRGSSLVCSELGDYYNYAPLSGSLSPISSH